MRSCSAQTSSAASGTSTAIRPSDQSTRSSQVEDALRLAAAPLAERQQPAEPRIGRPVGRIDQDGHAVGQIEPAADDQADAGHLGGLMGADDAGEAVAVDDGQRLDAEDGGVREQFLAGRCAAQEREMRCDLQFGIARRSSEDPVQEPLVGSGRGILAVAGAEDPEALAGIVLDLEIVAHRDQFGVALPPFAEDPLGTVGPPDPPAQPRQVKLTGGWSGSRATVSIGSGGAAAGPAGANGRASRRRSPGPPPATRWTERSGTSLATGANR